MNIVRMNYNSKLFHMLYSLKWFIVLMDICLLSVYHCYPIAPFLKDGQSLYLHSPQLELVRSIRLKRWLPPQLVPMTKQEYNRTADELKKIKEHNSPADLEKIKELERKIKMEDEFIEQQKAINATIDGKAIDIFGNSIELGDPTPRPSWVQTKNGWTDQSDENMEGGMLEKDYGDDDSKSGTGKLLCAMVEEHLKKKDDSGPSTENLREAMEGGVIKKGCKPTESNEIEVNIKKYGFNEHDIQDFKKVFNGIGIKMDDEGNVRKLSEKSKERVLKLCDDPDVWDRIDDQLTNESSGN